MNKASATIKLTKSEIEWIIISLVMSKRLAEDFDKWDDSKMYNKLREDFINIKEQNIQGEEKLEKKQYPEEKARTGKEACEECD